MACFSYHIVSELQLSINGTTSCVDSVRVFIGGTWRRAGGSESESCGRSCRRRRVGLVGWTECVFTLVWRRRAASAAHLQTTCRVLDAH